MITVITGQPGAGKTALAVSMLLEEQGTRPLFVMGVPELKIPHEKTPPVNEWTHLVESEEDPDIVLPKFAFPPGSIILIDEAQNVYRPRASTSKVPDYVAAFETHRHTGVDFWLLTQDAAFLDANVKRLAGRHIHLTTNLLGKQTLHEWTKVANVENKSELAAAAKRPYKPNKKVFGLYKSSTKHLKHKRRIPWSLWLVLVMTILAATLGYRVYSSVMAKVDPSGAASAAAAAAPGQQGAASLGAKSPPVDPLVATSVALAKSAMDAAPRVPSQPETAPMYDSVRPPITQAPRMAACVASKHKCTCYTDQATVYPSEEASCREFVRNPPFDPRAASASPPGQPMTTDVLQPQVPQSQPRQMPDVQLSLNDSRGQSKQSGQGG